MGIADYTYRPPSKAVGGSNGPINVVVLHDLECPLGKDKSGVPYERSLIGPNYFGDPNMTSIKSIHYISGSFEICQGADEDTLAWHARGASKGSIGIEQTGYASFTLADWTSKLGMAMLNNTARLLADIYTRRGISLRFITGQALRNAYADHSNLAAGGVTTHRALTEAGVGGNDHTDPGTEYPIDYVLSTAQQIAGGTAPSPARDWFILDWLAGAA